MPYDDFVTTKETQVKVVWACIKIIRAFTRNSARREKKVPKKEALAE